MNAMIFVILYIYNVLLQVISLYEYEPTRADELALQPNDVITVLSEENSNWWMGQMPDGRQGYFPVNYVMEMSKFFSL